MTKPESWTAIDELWYNYRDPVAECVSGALERLRSLRVAYGWMVPFKGAVVFIPDGTDENADVARDMLEDD